MRTAEHRRHQPDAVQGMISIILSIMGNSATSERASNVEQHSVLGEVGLSEAVDEEGNGYEQMTIMRVIESEAEFNRWYK